MTKGKFGVTVGITTSRKPVSIPIRGDDLEKFGNQFGSGFDWFEVFEIYAMTEYLLIAEKRKIEEKLPSGHWEIYQKISLMAREYLELTNKFSDAMKKSGIQNSLGIIKLGRYLVLPEFKRI